MERRKKWEKLFKNGPSKICWRQPLKNKIPRKLLLQVVKYAKANHGILGYISMIY